MSDHRLADRVWIVTGAASGIGRAIARLFASQGAQVVIADVTQEVIEGGTSTLEVIASEGGKAVFLPTDVSQWAQVETMVAETVSRYGRLDGIVKQRLHSSRATAVGDRRGRLGPRSQGQSDRHFFMLPGCGRTNDHPGAARRGPGPDRQFVFAARHDRSTLRHRLWHHKGWNCVSHQADSDRLRRSRHCLQRGRARQDSDWRRRPCDRSARARPRFSEDAMAAAWAARRCSAGGVVFGERRCEFCHRHQFDGGWRMDRGLRSRSKRQERHDV